MGRIITYGWESWAEPAPGITGTPSTIATDFHGGSHCGEITGSAVTTQRHGWEWSLTGLNNHDYFLRFYFKKSGNPSGAVTLTQLGALSGGFFGALILNTDGTLKLQRNGSIDVGSPTSALADNAWYRLGLRVRCGSTSSNGQVEGLLNGVQFAVATGVNVGTGATPDTLRVGVENSTGGTGGVTLHYDDVALNDDQSAIDASWPGPLAESIDTYAQAILGDGPSLYLRLGETSGTAAADQVGGASGTYSGGFTIPSSGLLPADADGAVALNGSTGYVAMADRTALHLGDVFTLECWVKPTAYRDNAGLGGSFVDKGSGGYIMRFADALDGRFILRRNSVATIVTSTASVPLNVASHVVVTKNGATVKQYLNGTDVTGTVTNSTIADTTFALGVGAADGGTDNFLPGTLDEVGIYPTALSAAQVQRHYLIGVRARMLSSTGAGA